MSIAINTPLPAFAVAAPTEVKSPVPTIMAAVKRVAVAFPRVRDPSLSDLLPDFELLFSFLISKSFQHQRRSEPDPDHEVASKQSRSDFATAEILVTMTDVSDPHRELGCERPRHHLRKCQSLGVFFRSDPLARNQVALHVARQSDRPAETQRAET